MCALNSIGVKLSALKGINAVTDVTGFGLAGHLLEVCKGSKVSAEIYFDKLPLLPNILKYIENDFDFEIPKLFSDKAFVGGAVAVPYKEKIIKFTSNKEQILQGPKAVNCLVRDKNRLLGYNTDGIATIKILEKQLNLGKVDQILVLGTGGMAKAVVSELYIKHPSMPVFVFDRKKNCMVFKGGTFQNVFHKFKR